MGSPRQKNSAIDVPDGFALPAKTKWAFRPDIWKNASEFEIQGTVLSGTELGAHVTLHHDGKNAAFNICRPDGDKRALQFTFSRFDGSFVSLAFALPQSEIRKLGRHDLLRLGLESTTSEPFEAYARLNLCYGPNTEQITRMIEIGRGQSFAEFDIFYTAFEPLRAADIWIDLIINAPQNRVITITNAVILRRTRASL
ncbi:MAG: DUF6478 family protein [Paracoccaceae bacterium]